jgi:hypothetical protein
MDADRDWEREQDERDWERREEQDRRQTETFRRIHRLYKRGFRPDWSVTAVEDAIWWTHAGGGPDLIVYPDGKLVALDRAVLNPNDNGDKDRIYNDSKSDVALFNRWLATVRPPSWWQAGAAARQRYIVMPLVLVALYAVTMLFGWGIDKIARNLWHSMFG